MKNLRWLRCLIKNALIWHCWDMGKVVVHVLLDIACKCPCIWRWIGAEFSLYFFIIMYHLFEYPMHPFVFFSIFTSILYHFVQLLNTKYIHYLI